MMTCLPQSFFSWDFYVEGASGGPVEIRFNFFTEQGSIEMAEVDYSVEKHGWLSGHWILKKNGKVQAEAKKNSAFFREFDIRCGDCSFRIASQAAFHRAYNFYLGNRTVGEIRPAHAFTRRATLKCDSDIPEIGQLFAFWLVVLTWKRSDSAGNAS